MRWHFGDKFLSVLLISALTGAASAAAAAPVDLVSSGVDSFWLSPPRVVWLDCESGAVTRVPTYGGMFRRLFEDPPSGGEFPCDANTFRTNIVADAQYAYWAGGDGVFRLSLLGNLGDEPELLAAAPTDADVLVIDGDYLYVTTYDSGGDRSTIHRVDKQSGARVVVANVKGPIVDLQVAQETLFWTDGSSALFRQAPGDSAPVFVDDNVTAFAAVEGGGARVFFAQDSRILVVDSPGSVPRLLFRGPSNMTITRLVSDGSFVLFFDERSVDDGELPVVRHLLSRLPVEGGTPDEVELIYTSEPSPGQQIHNAVVYGDFLFWQEDSVIKRLPVNEPALPQVNVELSAVEVTQSIQDPMNRVPLIRDRRTFVRAHVRSTTGNTIPHVFARLRAMWLGGQGGPIATIGLPITVNPSPDVRDLTQSYLFEIPISWTRRSALRLTVEVNPWRVPIETQYTDNARTEGPFEFIDPPDIGVTIFEMGFDTGNPPNVVTVYPSQRDSEYIEAWLRAAYPLPEDFRLKTVQLYDADLGNLINAQTSWRETTVSRHLRSRLHSIRMDSGSSDFYYAVTGISAGACPSSGAGANCWARGAADPKFSIATGPVATGAPWDTDGSTADWYAAHEIGHLLGRKHPWPASDDPSTSGTEGCGHSRSDLHYPYGDHFTGPLIGNDASGFRRPYDSAVFLPDEPQGRTQMHIPAEVYTSMDGATDVMGYCDDLWISDYTYLGIWAYATALDVLSGSGQGAPAERDALAIYGSYGFNRLEGSISLARQTSVPKFSEELNRGDVEVRLLDEAGSVLHQYLVEGTQDEDELQGIREFYIAVPFPEGLRRIELVSTDNDSRVLATLAVNSDAPTVGTVTARLDMANDIVVVDWNRENSSARDTSFDILVSVNGHEYRPLALGVTGDSLQIAREEIGGGSVVFRVIASRGVRTAEAISEPLSLPVQPPEVWIVSPAAGDVVRFGETVTFQAVAEDPQGEDLLDDDFSWSILYGPRPSRTLQIGRGRVVQTDRLPVGSIAATVSVDGHSGLMGSKSISLVVVDDLDLPGPGLSVVPRNISWIGGDPSFGPYEALVSVSNMGSGTLRWRATPSAPWLSLAPATGIAPAKIAVNAASGALAGRDRRSAWITIDGVDSNGATISSTRIPVDLFRPTQSGGIFGPACPGDCNRDEAVSVDELVVVIQAALRGSEVDRVCPDADADGSGSLAIDDLVRSVGSSIRGCP